MTSFRLAAIQMNSSANLDHNLEQAAFFIKSAKNSGAEMIVLPENFAFMSSNIQAKLAIAEDDNTGPIQAFLSKQASLHKVWLIGGSLPLKSPDPHKVYNACPVYDAAGNPVACYRKIHLFDAKVKPETEIYEESKTTYAGDQPTVVKTPFGRLGLAICYDLRFPELFRLLAKEGAEIIALPTAFTHKTGEAHWEILMRARAIENFCYLIGACQTGSHESGRQTYGHSMIIHPWGQILACLPDELGVCIASIAIEEAYQIRQNFPVHEHKKLF